MIAALWPGDGKLGRCWILASSLPVLAGPFPWVSGCMGCSTGSTAGHFLGGHPWVAEAWDKDPPSKWEQPEGSLFLMPPKSRCCHRIIQFPFSFPSVQCERIHLCKEPPSDSSAWDGQNLLLKLCVDYLSKLLLSLWRSAFLVADCFSFINTYCAVDGGQLDASILCVKFVAFASREAPVVSLWSQAQHCPRLC